MGSTVIIATTHHDCNNLEGLNEGLHGCCGDHVGMEGKNGGAATSTTTYTFIILPLVV